jgi:ribosome biogenesis GTPase
MSPLDGTQTRDPGSPQEGLVVAIAHGYSEVAADGHMYLCMLRGRLLKRRTALPLSPARRQPLSPYGRVARSARHERPAPAPTTPVEAAEATPTKPAPGDHVRFLPLGSGQGIIEDILPRRTTLTRARSEAGTEQVMLANLDHAVLVFAVREPSPRFGMLDRYLALCEHARVDITICLNKIDLGLPMEVADAHELYSRLGYLVLQTSATTFAGVTSLCERLAGRVSLLTGPSGVGKSSLINVLLPHVDLRTGAISEATGKGRHTTTGVRLLPLEDGGWLADSAGLRELALWNVPPEDLPHAFVELRPYLDQCAFDDCEHGVDEEGCAVRRALADGAISPARFASFERLLHEARAVERPAW